MRVVIGIDPDVSKNGVAMYQDGKLVELKALCFCELQKYTLSFESPLVVVEDVMKNTATFASKGLRSEGQKRKKSYQVGRVAQVGHHIIQFLEAEGIDYRLKPIASHWKKNPEQFKRFTGWVGRSNEDTRSAAYFGFLEAQKHA